MALVPLAPAFEPRRGDRWKRAHRAVAVVEVVEGSFGHVDPGDRASSVMLMASFKTNVPSASP